MEKNCVHAFASFLMLSSDVIMLCTNRTIMALWKTRTISVDEKAEIADEQQEQDGKCICPDDIASSLIIEDTNMTKVYSAEIPANVSCHTFLVHSFSPLLVAVVFISYDELTCGTPNFILACI